MEVSKNQVFKAMVDDEPGWFTALGFHNGGGIQARLETPLDSKKFKIGDMVKINPEEVLQLLPEDDLDDD